jgi:hypothetical protein
MDRWRGLARLVRRVTTALVITLCAAGTLVATPDAACACDCGQPSASEAFERADAVFIGQVVEVKRPWFTSLGSDTAVWTFEVSEVYKGEVRRRQEVVSHAHSTACGLDLEGSEPFVVFASTDGTDPTPAEGQLAAHRCNGTGPVTAEIRRMLARIPASDPAPPSVTARQWPWTAGIAGIGVLATGAWWLWRRRRRPTG